MNIHQGIYDSRHTAGEHAVSGDVRGAGSPVPAAIQLVGSDGVSDFVTIADDPDYPGARVTASQPIIQVIWHVQLHRLSADVADEV